MPKGSSHLPIQTVRNSSTTLHAPIPLSAMPYTTRIIHLCELPASFPMNRAIIHPQKKTTPPLRNTHTHTASFPSRLCLYICSRVAPRRAFLFPSALRVLSSREKTREDWIARSRVYLYVYMYLLGSCEMLISVAGKNSRTCVRKTRGGILSRGRTKFRGVWFYVWGSGA